MASFLSLINYGFVLLYGVFLTVSFAGGCKSKKERLIVGVLSVLILMTQCVSYSLLGFEETKKLYPFIAHLPLLVMLVLFFKKPWGIALVSIFIAYFCCQLPRWMGTVFLYLFNTSLSYELGYLFSLPPLYLLLRRYVAVPAYQAMTYSKRSLAIIGGLPLFYYLFDYATTVYTNALYSGVKMVLEFLPTIMALFYVAFVSIYHNEVQQRNQLQQNNAILEAQAEYAKNEISALQQVQQQTAVYRHDVRHHLTLLRGYLEAGEFLKAKEYVDQAQISVDEITPIHYCDNNTINLILSSFANKATQQGIRFDAKASIPAALPLSDIELCALFSNALENAITATAKVDQHQRTIRFNCQTHKDKFLIYISNPYTGTVKFKDGLPKASQEGHGLGVKSIKLMVEKHGGYFSFEALDGVFTLKVVLPLKGAKKA